MKLQCPPYVDTVLRTLRASGREAWLVGGCVRDLLRGAAPSDYDVASAAPPEEVLALFGPAAHPTGLAHGTVTVVSGGRPVEITTLRRDGAYRDGRHPVSVRFTDRIEEDLARRDFTVNAMALAADGALVDPFGGREDLTRGLLRCVGRAEERFAEDALRILRALRFAAVLGFAVEEETARAARAQRALLDKIARERVFAELDRMLCGPGAADVLLAFPDVLGAVLPEILPCVGFAQKNPHHCYDVWEHTARSVGAAPGERALRWTMLFHDLGKPECFTEDEQGIGHFYGHTARSRALAGEIMPRLRFPRALREQVDAQLACFDDLFPPTRAGLHREMVKRGRETVGRLLETRRADNAAQAEADRIAGERDYAALRALYDELIAENACCAVGELTISGGTLAALGFEGRGIGATLEKLLDEVAAEKLSNTPEALQQRAERLWRSGFVRGKTT